MVNERRLLTVIVLLPYLKVSELVRFCQLNKGCYHLMQAVVNYRVLFENWGLILKPYQLQETLISATIALQVAAECIMRNSVTKS